MAMQGLRILLLGFSFSLFISTQAAEEFATGKGKVIVTPINHATLVIEWGGKTIYVDPVGMADWY